MAEGDLMEPKIVVHVVRGEQDLISVDPLSIQILLLLKMHDVPNVHIVSSKFSVSADLPKLIVNGEVFTNPSVIRRKLDNLLESKSIDNVHSKKDLSRIKAYKEVLVTLFNNLYVTYAWGVEENLVKSIEYWSKDTYYPCKTFFARNLRRKMTALVEDIHGDDDPTNARYQQFTRSEPYTQDFEHMLGNNEYLFGDKPSTLDIYLCSYLAPMILLKYPNLELYDPIIAQRLQLRDFVQKMVSKFIAIDKPKVTKAEEVDLDRAPITTIISAGAVATTLMLLYAFNNNILRISGSRITFNKM